MIDCGFSVRETEKRLDRLGLDPTAIDAVFVTHEHGDHSAGVARLARKYNLDVFMSHGTYNSGRCGEIERIHFCASEQLVEIGNLCVLPVAVPHDAREPCQFVISGADLTLGILTDLGMSTPFVSRNYHHCDALVLEFNHDPLMLAEGSYPISVKRRVGGDWGHLSNDQSADLLKSLAIDNIQHLVIAHISEKNNQRELAETALARVYPHQERVVWADQALGFDWLDLIPATSALGQP
jgi:phosphoribosyl 1,2-cyclic phosphodiesterase